MTAEYDDKYYKNLYKWNKHESKLNSKIKESDNIQSIHQWLRKVEDASDKAINNTFGAAVKNSNKSKSTANLVNLEKKNLIDIQHEIARKTDPYSEAHDLINEWVTDKIRLDMDDDFYNYVDVNEMNSFSSNEKALNKIKSELLANDQHDTNDYDLLDIKGIDYDKYDEQYITKDIMSKIMRKEFFDKSKLLTNNDSRRTVVDTRAKIEMRHQAVKENREKRLREIEVKRRERLEKKEIELKAKQMILKEEQEKKIKADIEKQLIEQEAQRLRLEMAQQRQKDLELRKKQRELEHIQIEKEKQEMYNIQKKLDLENVENAIELKRYEMAQKRAEDLADSFIKSKNLRILQKVFSSWYGLVLELRIKSGKAKALADWRLSYKVFNSWKKMAISEKVKKQQEQHEHVIKKENVKNVKAINYYNKKLLEKFFEEWKKYTKSALLSKQIQSERMNAKTRMEKFLNAIVETTNNQQEQAPITDGQSSNRNNKLTTLDLKRSKSFEALDQTPTSQSFRTKTSRVKFRSNYKPSGMTHQTPKSNHENNDDLSDSLENIETPKLTERELNKKVKDAMWPWVKSPFPVNKTFDNRFKAQEKILQEQTKMIKEQQRMIENLKFEQSQIAFKEQMIVLEQIKAKQLELEKMQKLQYQQEKDLMRKKFQIAKLEKTQKKSESDLESVKIDLEQATTNEEQLDFTSNDEKTNTDKLTNRSFSQTSRTNQTTNSIGQLADNSTAGSEKKIDGFLKNMQDRAKMREQLKKEREEKKRKFELEKLEQLKVQQEEKLKLDEEERKKKAEELKEKRRVQQILEAKKNAEKIKEQQAVQKADNFYRKHLLRYYGMNGLKKLMDFRNKKTELADKIFRTKAYKMVFTSWKIWARLEMSVKEKIADELNRKILLKNYYFNGIKLFKQSAQIEMAKAGRFYRYNVKEKLFNAWKVYVKNERERSIHNEVLIENHNLQRIRVKYFKMWKEYPAEMRRLKARQKRIEDLRSKVKEIVPDFD